MLGVILGSAFSGRGLDLSLRREEVPVLSGSQEIYRVEEEPGGVVIFRHGRPHRRLPHQIDYRAQARALAKLGCRGLLCTSSVGVLDPSIPLHRPLLIADLLTLDNRLPDGSPCTSFLSPSEEQGHLVLDEGLFSSDLSAQVRKLAEEEGAPIAADVVFGYAPGPRTKTAAENRMWLQLGAQVNSMSLAPEVILANELGVPCAGLAVGHKYSLGGDQSGPGRADIAASLESSRSAMERLCRAFLQRGRPAAFGNHIYRFD